MEESFTTETIIVIPSCTALSNPVNGATNVPINTDLSWTSVNTATGYFITIGTTAGGTDIENNTDLGNVTTYTPASDLDENTTYYVTITPYNTAGNAISCVEESFTTECTLTVDSFDSVSACDSYTLPTLNFGNYFTESLGMGSLLFAGDMIIKSQKVFVYASNSYCEAETSFEIIINETPEVDTLDDVSVNNVYVLPSLFEGDYFTEPHGSGTALFAGDRVLTSQTLYIYAETGTSPNLCIDESSFSISIIPYIDYMDFFTPNGNGENDYWQILGVERIQQGTKIFIFDRFGKLVAQLDPNGIGWDGNYNGQPLPSSEYWFRVLLVDGNEMKGNFSLLRK